MMGILAAPSGAICSARATHPPNRGAVCVAGDINWLASRSVYRNWVDGQQVGDNTGLLPLRLSRAV
jgi:hypothetical protein